MPQVQVLPAVPSFGTSLAQALGQATGSLAQGAMRGYNARQDAKVLQALQNNQSANPWDAIRAFQQLSPEAQHSLQPILRGLLPRLSAGTQEQHQAAQEAGEYRQTVDRLNELLEGGNIGFFEAAKAPFFAETRADRSEFNTLATKALSLARQVLPAGIRNQKEFDALVKRLVPSENDTKAKIRGKIDALESYVQQMEAKSGAKNKMAERKQKQSRALDQEKALEFLSKANGDKQKARELAKKSGYTF